MAARRSAIPIATRAAVLKEFSHLCAICGTRDPQIHHIDENRGNNSPLNLLPLCPNHHLTDQHNPTRKIETGRLRLFREWKDPAILSPQFEPLYRRLVLLQYAQSDLEEDCGRAEDFCNFVRSLRMGRYYANKFHDLIKPPLLFVLTEQAKRQSEQYRVQGAQLINRINDCYAEITRLTVELLRYQDWPAGEINLPLGPRQQG